MIIRKVEEKDILEIKKLLGIVWDNTYKQIFPQKIIDEAKLNWHSIEKLKKQAENKKFIFLLAEENEQIIGILTSEIKGDIYHLSRLYILPNFQGKKIGKNLLENLIENNTIKEIFLSVEENNEKAISFYKKEGFEIVDKKVDLLLDFELKTLIMKKNCHN
ncbi:MAG: GNAT family N-acetyltransferase [Candidatus Sericytochromatia bacterium]